MFGRAAVFGQCSSIISGHLVVIRGGLSPYLGFFMDFFGFYLFFQPYSLFFCFVFEFVYVFLCFSVFYVSKGSYKRQGQGILRPATIHLIIKSPCKEYKYRSCFRLYLVLCCALLLLRVRCHLLRFLFLPLGLASHCSATSGSAPVPGCLLLVKDVGLGSPTAVFW